MQKSITIQTCGALSEYFEYSLEIHQRTNVSICFVIPLPWKPERHVRMDLTSLINDDPRIII